LYAIYGVMALRHYGLVYTPTDFESLTAQYCSQLKV
jgi:hypothetical protein